MTSQKLTPFNESKEILESMEPVFVFSHRGN